MAPITSRARTRGGRRLRLSALHPTTPAGRRARSRLADTGQTALVAVLALTLGLMTLGAVLVKASITSGPLQQARSVQFYAYRALEAGINSYLTAVNTNPGLAQCSSATNGSGTCTGLNYETWNKVQNSDKGGSDPEYYSFGNPQPTFNSSTTGSLAYVKLQVVGAAYDLAETHHYLFETETMTVAPANGFLNHVWWTNYESFSSTGNYTNCPYDWNNGYTAASTATNSCGAVFFGTGDTLNGPVWSNDSIYLYTGGGNPSFGTASGWPGPTNVETADPKCLFVDGTYGDNGSNAGCDTIAAAFVAACAPLSAAQTVASPGSTTRTAAGSTNCQTDTGTYLGTATSSYGNTVEPMPASNTQLQTIAQLGGCLYAGPTQIKVNGTSITVSSPDTPSSGGYSTMMNTANGNTTTNTNQCPVNGSGTLGSSFNGVIYTETATTNTPWSNPFDNPEFPTNTNVTSSPAIAKSTTVTLTAKVAPSDGNGTVAFSYKTSSIGAATTITGCSAQPLGSPTGTAPNQTYSATCSWAVPSTYTTSYVINAAFSGDTTQTSVEYTGNPLYEASTGKYGTTSSGSTAETYGPDAQVQSQCSLCYYGQTATPDTEADDFVQGTISGGLTIASANDIIIDGDLTYTHCTWTTYPGSTTAGTASESYCGYNAATGAINDALGLIAQNYVEVNQPVVSGTTTLTGACTTLGLSPEPLCGMGTETTTGQATIDAAVLAINDSFVVNNYGDGGLEGHIVVYGSIEQNGRGPVGTSGATGYTKYYTWDPLLPFVSPPDFLTPSTPSWSLGSTSGNSVNFTTTSCPADLVPNNQQPNPASPTKTTTAYCTSSLTNYS